MRVRRTLIMYGTPTKAKLEPEWYTSGDVKIYTDKEIANYELSRKALTKLEECRTMSKAEIEKLDSQALLESKQQFNQIMRGFSDDD